MWIVSALLVLTIWTAVGFVAALLFFRLGFGFERREREAELVPQPERERGMAGDHRYVLTPVDRAARSRLGDAAEQLAHGRLERAEPLNVAG